MGSYYGALTVHAGLWDSARETFDSLLARLAIIHLVHEARGLDVNPVTIARFKNAGAPRARCHERWPLLTPYHRRYRKLQGTQHHPL